MLKYPSCWVCKYNKGNVYGKDNKSIETKQMSSERCKEWESDIARKGKMSKWLERVSYIAHMPGHKNSKGEAAPWVVKKHETGEVLSSHKSEGAAKEHLRNMQIRKHMK